MIRHERLVGSAAVGASVLYIATDVAEWFSDFSPLQLWANYVGFAATPFFVIGLYAVQHARIGWAGLVGALLYGASFVYFAHTSLYAIAEASPDYQTMWAQLGPLYTFHGVVMIVGAVLFGEATRRAGVLPRWTGALLIVGALVGAVFGALPVPEVSQTLASTLRNVAFIGMGVALLRGGTPESQSRTSDSERSNVSESSRPSRRTATSSRQDTPSTSDAE